MTPAAALISALAIAAPPALTTIPLEPPESQVGYTVYALGLIPFPARFLDFTGSLTLDPHLPAACQVQVTVRIASLHTSDPARDAQALGPSMLDAAHYPTMGYSGHCEAGALAGILTLHGVSRPLSLAVQRVGRHVTATGTLLRRDYNITGMAGLVGQRIRIRLDAVLPRLAAQDRAP